MTTLPAAALGSMVVVRVAVWEPVGTRPVLRSVCLARPDVRLPVSSSSSLLWVGAGVVVCLLVVDSPVSDASASMLCHVSIGYRAQCSRVSLPAEVSESSCRTTSASFSGSHWGHAAASWVEAARATTRWVMAFMMLTSWRGDSRDHDGDSCPGSVPSTRNESFPTVECID